MSRRWDGDVVGEARRGVRVVKSFVRKKCFWFVGEVRTVFVVEVEADGG